MKPQPEQNMAVAVQARWIVPINAAPRRDACLTFADGRIVSVGENVSGRPAIDLGDVAILPGLINAHTHLEFSDLAQPWGEPQTGFADWIRTVVVGRRSRLQTSPQAPAQQPAHLLGIEESLAAGITNMGEIATAPVPYECYDAAPAELTVFRECLGLSEEQIEPLLAAAEAHLQQTPQPGALWQAGLSPHAPYTVHPRLFTGLVKLAATRRVPLAFHLAESQQEIELLESGTGPLRAMLEDFGVWNPQAFRSGTRPADFLRQATPDQCALWIHGNYLNEKELDLLAGMPRSSLVHCARTHAFFGHDPFPWEACRARGIRVVLGTDSRASNPDLNLWADLRLLRDVHGFDPAELLRMATLGAAAALGVSDSQGSLEPGKLANLAVFQLSDPDTADPLADLLQSANQAARTYVRGRQVWPRA